MEDTQSFKINKGLLDELRPVAKRNKRTVQGQIELYLEQGLRGNKEFTTLKKQYENATRDGQQIIINYSELMKSHVALQEKYNELEARLSVKSR